MGAWGGLLNDDKSITSRRSTRLSKKRKEAEEDDAEISVLTYKPSGLKKVEETDELDSDSNQR